MKRTQVYLEPTQHVALKREAAEQGISLAELIRRLVSEHLERREGNPKHAAEAYRRLVGLGSSGKTDIAAHHDRYLAKALSDRHRS